MLIVDRDPQLRERVAGMASRLGYRPTMAADPIDALFYLMRTAFAVVITDDDLTTMDGRQLAVRVKRKHTETRVIVMTADRSPAILDRCRDSGVVDGVLIKPFNLQTLKAQVEGAGLPAAGPLPVGAV